MTVPQAPRLAALLSATRRYTRMPKEPCKEPHQSQKRPADARIPQEATVGDEEAGVVAQGPGGRGVGAEARAGEGLVEEDEESAGAQVCLPLRAR
jgi:hypothetical protein